MKRAIITAGIVALMLTGCGGQVELNEENTMKVAQYAAELVLKYDSNYKERLLTLEEEAQAKEKLRQAAERDEKLKELLEQKNNAENTTGSEKTKSEINKEASEENQQEAEATYMLNDVLKVEGFSFQMNGYDVVEEYPEATKDVGEIPMEVRAAAGKKLLLVKCTITNITDTKAECNLFDKDISAKVVVDGTIRADSMITMLLNDFCTLKVEIEPAVSYESVLVFEIPEESANMQSVELNMTIEGTSYNIAL